ncbi:Peptidoglycan N-acetylglucosamine deacetylase [Lactobacillus zymae] [Lactiplantibacillus mudanjiangensis]|uniref:Peptidoglycan N-acetylglucosamine deacetylase [Lactobacillus zymae] n=2 Tax=Lactiplantibacillus mudanjiangensis TaxID=1296538 RepID=A0A660DTB7_9LACO|nr:polysaccharide deacetylase family protein [Lactiplantibacillus mudanjiangensis]VDG20996.1 Peptidoglycan N-acetylglucosamine deacetylase [Lactobacillus zymae] [Lactiplantibacillus mudanjiangensis]VDG22779.1 Peptidoglycan N-acetylglucosamine deacetylase [Lactobacillus zymae] [Lactiplantibacillus mudanjiangensis]VDG26652.1 Peptidoglycan N-acetylglucosamine deacetylase [Lactobacillus zymae] [Lactiplantibacillus mudanjiangensis]VDG31883.1 Peptidoglycan N-acetylglucosamine deacetylase [Lactobacill
MKMRQLKIYGLSLLVVIGGLGSAGLPAQAASQSKTVTFGQLTNQNPHRLAAIREVARQAILTKTHAKASRVPAVYQVKLPTHMTKKATLTTSGLRMNLLPNKFNVKQVTLPYAQLTGKILNRYLPKSARTSPLKYKKVVALTFDDGPDPTLTPRLLKTLKANHVHATFFEVGQSVSRYPKITRAVLAAGNEVGNHSWNHPDFSRIGTSASVNQVIRTDQAIYAATGKLPQYMRPPYGNITAAEGRQIQHPIIRWSVDSRDWALLNTQKDIQSVLSATRSGSIVLMHDIHAPSVAAVPTIIKRLKAKGYHFVTVSQLLNQQALPGLQYFAAGNYRTAGK